MRQKALRQIRTAGWAAVAYAGLQLLALPAVVWRVDGHWTWAPTTALQILPTIVLAWLALRGSRLAALILGAYSVYRVSLFGLAVVRVLDGTAAKTQWGPAWLFGTMIALPFAIFWLRGGIAALRTIRDGDSSEATA